MFTGAPACHEATENGAVREDEQHPAAPQLVSILRSIFEIYHEYCNCVCMFVAHDWCSCVYVERTKEKQGKK